MGNLASLAAEVVLALCGLGLLCCAFMFFRNQWVYREKQRLLKIAAAAAQADIRLGPPFRWQRFYDALPDYDDMMRRWWIWDARKFLKPGSPLLSATQHPKEG